MGARGAQTPPGGYAPLVTYAGSQAINASLYPKIPFDTIKDFQTVATLAVTPFILIVHPKLPAKDLEEFIALTRAKPGALRGFTRLLVTVRSIFFSARCPRRMRQWASCTFPTGAWLPPLRMSWAA